MMLNHSLAKIHLDGCIKFQHLEITLVSETIGNISEKV